MKISARGAVAADQVQHTMRTVRILGALLALFASNAFADSTTKTLYTLPQNIRWLPDTQKPPGSYYAILRSEQNGCGELRIQKFPDGYTYPMHVNKVYRIFTIIKGTLVIGFDEHRLSLRSASCPPGLSCKGL